MISALQTNLPNKIAFPLVGRTLTGALKVSQKYVKSIFDHGVKAMDDLKGKMRSFGHTIAYAEGYIPASALASVANAYDKPQTPTQKLKDFFSKYKP